MPEQDETLRLSIDADSVESAGRRVVRSLEEIAAAHERAYTAGVTGTRRLVDLLAQSQASLGKPTTVTVQTEIAERKLSGIGAHGEQIRQQLGKPMTVVVETDKATRDMSAVGSHWERINTQKLGKPVTVVVETGKATRDLSALGAEAAKTAKVIATVTMAQPRDALGRFTRSPAPASAALSDSVARSAAEQAATRVRVAAEHAAKLKSGGYVTDPETGRSRTGRSVDRESARMADELRAAIRATGKEVDSLGTALVATGGKGAAAMGKVVGVVERLPPAIQGAIGAAAGMAAIGAIQTILTEFMDMVTEVVTLASRYETLGTVMTTVGANANRSAESMAGLEIGLRRTGISAIQSRSNLATMVQAQIDLAQSTKLARVAQDAAVIGNINSSEAFDRMVHGISVGNTLILRNLGLIVDFETGYQKAATALGKTADALTQEEKVNARANAVMESGSRIAGSYEASMRTAGKQVQSTVRYMEDLKVALGTVFLPTYTAAVFGYAGALKWMADNVDIVVTAMAALATAVTARWTVPLLAGVANVVVGLGSMIGQSRQVVIAKRAEATEILNANNAIIASEQKRLAAAQAAVVKHTTQGAAAAVDGGSAMIAREAQLVAAAKAEVAKSQNAITEATKKTTAATEQLAMTDKAIIALHSKPDVVKALQSQLDLELANVAAIDKDIIALTEKNAAIKAGTNLLNEQALARASKVEGSASGQVALITNEATKESEENLAAAQIKRAEAQAVASVTAGELNKVTKALTFTSWLGVKATAAFTGALNLLKAAAPMIAITALISAITYLMNRESAAEEYTRKHADQLAKLREELYGAGDAATYLTAKQAKLNWGEQTKKLGEAAKEAKGLAAQFAALTSPGAQTAKPSTWIRGLAGDLENAKEALRGAAAEYRKTGDAAAYFDRVVEINVATLKSGATQSAKDLTAEVQDLAFQQYAAANGTDEMRAAVAKSKAEMERLAAVEAKINPMLKDMEEQFSRLPEAIRTSTAALKAFQDQKDRMREFEGQKAVDLSQTIADATRLRGIVTESNKQRTEVFQRQEALAKGGARGVDVYNAALSRWNAEMDKAAKEGNKGVFAEGFRKGLDVMKMSAESVPPHLQALRTAMIQLFGIAEKETREAENAADAIGLSTAARQANKAAINEGIPVMERARDAERGRAQAAAEGVVALAQFNAAQTITDATTQAVGKTTGAVADRIRDLGRATEELASAAAVSSAQQQVTDLERLAVAALEGGEAVRALTAEQAARDRVAELIQGRVPKEIADTLAARAAIAAKTRTTNEAIAADRIAATESAGLVTAKRDGIAAEVAYAAQLEETRRVRALEGDDVEHGVAVRIASDETRRREMETLADWNIATAESTREHERYLAVVGLTGNAALIAAAKEEGRVKSLEAVRAQLKGAAVADAGLNAERQALEKVQRGNIAEYENETTAIRTETTALLESNDTFESAVAARAKLLANEKLVPPAIAKSMAARRVAAERENELAKQSKQAAEQIKENFLRGVQGGITTFFESVFTNGTKGAEAFFAAFKALAIRTFAEIASQRVLSFIKASRAEGIASPKAVGGGTVALGGTLGTINIPSFTPDKSLAGSKFKANAGAALQGAGLGLAAGGAVGSFTTNKTVGAVGGALAGAAAGAMTGNPWAVLAGAIAGLVAGLFAAASAAKAMEKAQREAARVYAISSKAFREQALGLTSGLGDAFAAVNVQREQQRLQANAAFPGKRNEQRRNDELGEIDAIAARFKARLAKEFDESLDTQINALKEGGEWVNRRAEIEKAYAENLRSAAAAGEDALGSTEAIELAISSSAKATELYRLQLEELRKAQEKEAERKASERAAAVSGLVGRELTLAGDDRGALEVELAESRRKQTEAARELVTAGTLTEDEFRRLALVLDKEVARALKEFDEARARQREDFAGNLADRRGALGGKEAQAAAAIARLNRERDRELEAARKLVEQGIITTDMLNELASILTDELANAIHRVALEVANAKALFEEGLEVRRLNAINAVTGGDSDIRLLQIQHAQELREAVLAGMSDVQLNQVRHTQAIEMLSLTFQRETAKQLAAMDTAIDLQEQQVQALRDQATAMRQQADGLESQAAALRDTAKSLRAFVLGAALQTASPEDRLALTKKAFESATPENLAAAGQDYLDAALAYFGSGTGYQAILAQVQKAALGQAGAADAQADALAAQAGALRAAADAMDKQADKLQTVVDQMIRDRDAYVQTRAKEFLILVAAIDKEYALRLKELTEQAALRALFEAWLKSPPPVPPVGPGPVVGSPLGPGVGPGPSPGPEGPPITTVGRGSLTVEAPVVDIAPMVQGLAALTGLVGGEEYFSSITSLVGSADYFDPITVSVDSVRTELTILTGVASETRDLLEEKLGTLVARVDALTAVSMAASAAEVSAINGVAAGVAALASAQRSAANAAVARSGRIP